MAGAPANDAVATDPPLALVLPRGGRPPDHAALLEKAGFTVRVVKSAGEARALAAVARVCDAALIAELDPCARPLDQLIRERLSAMLDRLDGAPVVDLHALVLREVERGLLALVLERCRGHRGKAASQLGLHRNTLRQKIAELGLGPARKRRARR